MADMVPLNRRVDIRQEILSMDEGPGAPGGQLYHPQVDRAIWKKEELHKALREHREPTPLRKVNLERFKAKLRDQYLEGKGVDASQALADAMGSIQEAQEANKRTQDTNQAWMLNHTLHPWESPVGLVFPLSVVCVGDFWGGLTFGPCWVACGLPAPCAFGILWGWNIRAVRRGGVPAVRGRLEPLFSAWLGSLHSFCCARLTLVFGTASQGPLGHAGG